MQPEQAVDLGREAMSTALLIGAPVLIVGVVVGLLIGLVQALTQIQDQTVSFVPKIAAMIATVAFCLPWLMQMMIEYSRSMISSIPERIFGG